MSACHQPIYRNGVQTTTCQVERYTEHDHEAVCPACGEHCEVEAGDVLVALRQLAPNDAPAHDAMVEDAEFLRCVNVVCIRFAVGPHSVT